MADQAVSAETASTASAKLTAGELANIGARLTAIEKLLRDVA